MWHQARTIRSDIRSFSSASARIRAFRLIQAQFQNQYPVQGENSHWILLNGGDGGIGPALGCGGQPRVYSSCGVLGTGHEIFTQSKCDAPVGT